jgi:hypothetical protein
LGRPQNWQTENCMKKLHFFKIGYTNSPSS